MSTRLLRNRAPAAQLVVTESLPQAYGRLGSLETLDLLWLWMMVCSVTAGWWEEGGTAVPQCGHDHVHRASLRCLHSKIILFAREAPRLRCTARTRARTVFLILIPGVGIPTSTSTLMIMYMYSNTKFTDSCSARQNPYVFFRGCARVIPAEGHCRESYGVLVQLYSFDSVQA